MAHAVEFGAEAHEHEGAPCHLLSNEDVDDALALPPAAMIPAPLARDWKTDIPALCAAATTPRTALPPPTGPPALIL